MMTQDRANHPLALDQCSSHEEELCPRNAKLVSGPLGIATSLHMLPGDIYFYAANSSVLCVQREDHCRLDRKTPTSPRNLNPSAPAFRQGQAAPTSPKNLNPSAPAFRHSPAGEKSPSEGSYSGAETRAPGLTNGDVHANGTNYMVPLGGSGAGVPRGAGSHSLGALQGQGPQSTASMGLTLTPGPLMAVSTQSNHQPVVAAVVSQQQQQSAYVGSVSDNVGGHQVRASNQNSPASGIAESGENPPNGAVGVEVDTFETAGDTEELECAVGGQKYKYPDEVLAPIRKQMQFYFSNENLPNDKFLNQHMDSDKFIPLELFLDFGRIKPICNSVDQLLQAVESSSILELSEDRKRVRVSQCRKTLTLRGFPASATEEDVRQFILEMGASVPTHIEFVMYKEKYSVWYVSFKDENAALNSFFQFHNQKAVYKDHNIGCCIKSSGTLAAAGYFPSTEESNQRRLAHQSQAAVAAPVHAVQSAMPQPQPQQAQALMQPFSTMQLHPYMPGSPTGFYYQQAPQGAYMPYMTGMIQGWPGPTAAMEPGLIMQNNGLQPQHIRTSMPRPHLLPSGAGAQHRYNRPQRARQNLERSASERPSDRPPVVSVSGSSRSSPRSADGSTNATVIPQGAYVPRRPTGREDIVPQVMPQPSAVPHPFVTPMVTQQHMQSSAAPSTMVSQVTLEPMAVSHYQPAPPHHHQQSVLVHTTITGTTTAHPPPTQQATNSPHANTQQQMHHHHSHQPPPQMHPQQQQQQHHHHQQQSQQQPPQASHHQHPQPQTHHSAQHSSQLQQPPQLHYQQQQQANQAVQQHHHPHQQNMMAPHHHHHPQQPHHHPMPPPQVHHQQHHQQPLLGNRPERRGRRKREDNVRNQRSERNQSNRANFGTQVPTAADNFTMEANSFPPLPGALSSITSSEISHESRMSDIVRGISRMPGLGNSGGPRASSTTPSPVATPAPAPVISGASHGMSGSAILDSRSLDDGDSALDDDTSSSQEEVDTDANSLESRSVRSDPQSFPAEPSALPAQPRSQKACTPVASPASVSAQRQTENRQGPIQVQAPSRGPQQNVHLHQQQQYQVSPTAVSAATLVFEAPKLSYAQILALKNREAANNAGACDSNLIGALSPNPNSGTPNGSNSNHNTAPSASARMPNQSTNTFREHPNYQGGQQQHGSRSSQRGLSKDLSRSDGPPSSRPPNGSRRNSKESRTSNSFDRRKPDARQK